MIKMIILKGICVRNEYTMKRNKVIFGLDVGFFVCFHLYTCPVYLYLQKHNHQLPVSQNPRLYKCHSTCMSTCLVILSEWHFIEICFQCQYIIFFSNGTCQIYIKTTSCGSKMWSLTMLSILMSQRKTVLKCLLKQNNNFYLHSVYFVVIFNPWVQA